MSFFTRPNTAVDLSNKKRNSRSWIFERRSSIILFALLMLMALFFAYHYYRKYKYLEGVVSNEAPIASVNPARKVIGAVENHMLLPSDEQPLLAQVNDLRALAGNKFFKNAIVGDDVLVYCKAQLSILYSPTRDKIIEVMPQALSDACRSSAK